MRQRPKSFTRLILWCLLLPFASAHAEHATSNPSGPQTDSGAAAQHPTRVCGGTFPVGPVGILGTPVIQLETGVVYRRFDSTKGVVFVTADVDSKLDPRPLGVGSIVQCSNLDIAVIIESTPPGLSDRCELTKAGSWQRLAKNADGSEKALILAKGTTEIIEGKPVTLWQTVQLEPTIPRQAKRGDDAEVGEDRPPAGIQTDAEGKQFQWVLMGGAYRKQYSGQTLKEFPEGSGKYFNLFSGEKLESRGAAVFAIPEANHLVPFTPPNGPSVARSVPSRSIAGGYQNRGLAPRFPIQRRLPASRPPPISIARSSCPSSSG